MTLHEAIIEPDDRGRFHLRRFIGKRPPERNRWKVFVENGGDRVILEAVKE